MKIIVDVKRRDTFALLLMTLAFSPIYQIIFVGFAVALSALDAPWTDIASMLMLMVILFLDVIGKLVSFTVIGIVYSCIFSYLRPLMSKAVVSNEEYEITKEGLACSSQLGHVVRPWHIVHKPKLIFGGIFIRYEAGTGSSLIPPRVFGDSAQRMSFYNELQGHAKA